MRAKLVIAVTVLAVAAAPALAQKVFIDYDKEADLESYKTWAYKEATDGKVQDPLMDTRIVQGLENMLGQGKLKKVDANPDLWATYSTTTEERTQYNTTNFGYGYGGGYGRYGRYGGGVGISSSQTTATNYTDGTLIVDLWDAKTKELVWRGTASSTLKASPDKLAKQIDKFYVKMRSKWDKTVQQAAKK